MRQWRLIFFFATLVAILTVAFLVIKLAQGYRPDFTKKTLRPTGLLVATSLPDGAQLWLDGKLKSATNTTLNLAPAEYQVEIKKDGYTSWKKKLEIEQELVTKTDAYLFATYPNLKALTFTGAAGPLFSPDGQKVVFSVSGASLSKDGLWVLDLSDRPLGLSREPRQIVQSTLRGRDFAKGEYRWLPDSKQVLITFKQAANKALRVPQSEENFLLDSDRLNPTMDLIDITNRLKEIQSRWQQEEELRRKAQISKLPEKLLTTIDGKTKDLLFSPDESKILYTATASASIPEDIIPSLPASNNQPQEREIKPGRIYVYDLKEDKNFFIMAAPANLSWFPTSKHLFIVQNSKISISEYDSTNLVDVYTGPFENTFAFPFPDGTRILILTSIGKDIPPNLYAVSLR